MKASGGGEFIDDWGTDHRCTIGLTGMSLSAVTEGAWTGYKGSGVFVDHDDKLVVHLDIETGVLTKTSKKEVQFRGTARVKDVELKDKWTGTFYLGLDSLFTYTKIVHRSGAGMEHYPRAKLPSGSGNDLKLISINFPLFFYCLKRHD